MHTAACCAVNQHVTLLISIFSSFYLSIVFASKSILYTSIIWLCVATMDPKAFRPIGHTILRGFFNYLVLYTTANIRGS